VIKFIFSLYIIVHLQEQEAREKAFRKPEESNFAGGENYPSRFKQWTIICVIWRQVQIEENI